MRVKILQQPMPEGSRGEVGERLEVTTTPHEGIWSQSELNLSTVEHAIRQRWPGLRPGDQLRIIVERVGGIDV